MALEYRVSNVQLEALRAGAVDVPARVSGVQVEVLRAGEADVPTRVSGIRLEVLRSVAIAVLPEFIDDDVDDEAFPISLSPLILPSFVDGSDDEAYPVFASAAPYTVKDVERNPYPARLPDGQVEQQEMLSEQQRIIREQHNKTQAGDTTFDYGLLLKNYPNQEFTLGSLGRFYHEDYGIILARYCQFHGMVESTYQGVPVGRLTGSSRVDWVVTNDFGASDRDMVMGISCLAAVPDDDTYGWVVTHGCNPVPMHNDSTAVALQNAPYSWSATGKVGLGIRGRVLGRRWGKAFLPSIPSGALFVTLEGLSPADLVFEIREAMADEILEIAALDGRVTSVEGRMTSAEGAISIVESAQTALALRISVEEAARVRDIASIRLVAAGTDWTTAIRAEGNAVRAEFTAADDAIRADMAQIAFNANAALAAVSGLNYAGLVAQIANVTTQIVGFSTRLDGFNLDLTGIAAGDALIAGSAVDADGNTYYTFTPTPLAEYIRDTIGTAAVAAGLLTITVNDAGDTITFSVTSEDIQDMLATFFTAGAGISLSYSDGGNSFSITSTITQYTDALAIAAIQVAPVTTTGATYTLVIGDAGAYRRFTNAAGCAITIPPNSAVAFPIGTTFTARTTVSAATNWVAGVGVTLNKVGGGTGGQVFAEIGATSQVKKVGTDEWDIIGAVT